MNGQLRKPWPGLFGLILMVYSGGLLAAESAGSAAFDLQSRVGHLSASPRTTVMGQSATLLPDGKWLLLGGERNGQSARDAALVDARENRTTALSSGLLHARSGHTATVLPDGSVLVLGGIGSDGEVVGAVERLSLATGEFSRIAIALLPRTDHTATLITDERGRVYRGEDFERLMISVIKVAASSLTETRSSCWDSLSASARTAMLCSH